MGCCDTMYNFSEVQNRLKTGDLVLWNGVRALSDFIKCFTCSRFSHSGIVMRMPDGIYVMHCTPNPENLIPRGETAVREGVIMTRMDQELASGIYYDCAVRPLKDDLSQAKKEALLQFYEANKGKGYEQNWIEVGNSYFDGMVCCTNRPSTSEFFCSEYCAASYQAIGLLGAPPPEKWKMVENGPNQPANEYSPSDLSPSGKSWVQPLFGPMINIKPPSVVKVSRCSAFFNCATGTYNAATFSQQSSSIVLWMTIFFLGFALINTVGCIVFLGVFPFYEVFDGLCVFFALFVFFYLMVLLTWYWFISGGAGDHIIKAHIRVMRMLRRPVGAARYQVHEEGKSEAVPDSPGQSGVTHRSTVSFATAAGGKSGQTAIELGDVSARTRTTHGDDDDKVKDDTVAPLGWSLRHIFCTKSFAALFLCFAINTALFGATAWYSFMTPSYADLQTAHLGAISSTSASLMIRNPEARFAVVEYKVADTSIIQWEFTLPLEVSVADDHTLVYTIDGLSPGTNYLYRISFDTVPEDATLFSGAFTTSPAPFSGTSFDFSITSCFLPSWPILYKVDGWANLYQHNPDFIVFLGDLIYSDQPYYHGDDVEDFQRLYRETFDSDTFRKVGSSIATYYMYDDHELKDNWSLENAVPYYNALTAWGRYAGNTNPVVYDGYDVHYYNFTYDDTPIFMLDTRRWRHPAGDENKTMIGEIQKGRLYQWLLDTQAEDVALGLKRFKFIASPSSFTAIDAPIEALRDTWTIFTTERDTIFQFINDNNITNVHLITAGDHQSFVIRVGEVPGMYEFSNSPVQAFENAIKDTFQAPDTSLFQDNGEVSYIAQFSITGRGTVANPRTLTYNAYKGSATTPMYSITLTAQ